MPYKDPEKQREYARKWVASRRQQWIEEQGSVCARCGQVDTLFEVDHVDRATKVDHRVWSWSKVRRDLELAKCQLLCQACHWEKTADENRAKETPHGLNGYKYFKCRCDTCREAKKKENALRPRAVKAVCANG